MKARMVEKEKGQERRRKGSERKSKKERVSESMSNGVREEH